MITENCSLLDQAQTFDRLLLLFLVLLKLEQSDWRRWCRSVTGQLILQWQENSEPGVFELKSAAKGSGDTGIKLFFFKMLALL